jgi:hypothetical protein
MAHALLNFTREKSNVKLLSILLQKIWSFPAIMLLHKNLNDNIKFTDTQIFKNFPAIQ